MQEIQGLEAYHVVPNLDLESRSLQFLQQSNHFLKILIGMILMKVYFADYSIPLENSSFKHPILIRSNEDSDHHLELFSCRISLRRKIFYP